MDKGKLELVTELRKKLHAAPELSGQEAGTRKMLMEFLREHSSVEIFDRGKWFYALRRASCPEGKKRPNIAFRADMDAVAVDEAPGLPHMSRNPGVAHKCGHDGHCATLAALALELDRPDLDRDVYFLFQHAEENGEGAKDCCAIIDECGVSEIYGLHNSPGLKKGHVELREGTIMCASGGITASFTGVSTHASSPELGKNPAFAIAELILSIPEMEDSSNYKGMTMCTVIHAETGTAGAFGVSASKGSLSVTCRARYDDDMEALERRFRERAVSLANNYGLGCDFSLHDVFPATVNHEAGTRKVREAARILGMPVEEMEEPTRGSEDFGHYLKRIPGAFFFIGSGDCPHLHSREFDFPDDIIETGVEIFKAIYNCT